MRRARMAKIKKKQKRKADIEAKAVVRPNLICLADVEEEATQWLWEPYIPVGKITILEGDPDSGKSYLSLAIAAHLTTGRHLPFGKSTIEAGLPRNVLMLIGEDGTADTIKPRFRKSGGTMERLSLLEGVVTTKEGEEDVYSSITLDKIPLLEKALEKTRPSLVVVDPFQCFLGAKVDMYRANETRPILSALSKLAEQHNCALLLIRHLKKLGDKTIYRGIGAIDILAAARSVLLAGRNPQPPNVCELIRSDSSGALLEPKDRFALVQTKCNLGKKGPSLVYSIDDTGLTIDGVSQLTAEDILNVSTNTGKQDVDDWLEEMLASGPKEANAVKAAAAAKGYGRYKLQGACDRLGVVRKPSGFGGAWVWELPATADGTGTKAEEVDDPKEPSVTANLPETTAPELGNIQHSVQ